jgi:hypothetical protein
MSTLRAHKNKEGLKTIFQAAIFYTAPMVVFVAIIHLFLFVASKIYGN